MLRACTESGNDDMASKIFNEIPAEMINNFHVNTFLACIANSSKIDLRRSFKVINQFPQLIDLVSMNTILSACSRAQTDEGYHFAKEILANMKNGTYGDFYPDVISYNNVLSAGRNASECLEIVQELRLSRKYRRYDYIEASPITYTNAIKACAIPWRSQNQDSANNTSTAMESLLVNVDVASKLFKMSRIDKQANSFVRSSYLHCIASLGCTKLIEDLFHYFHEDGILVYNALFRSWAIVGPRVDGEIKSQEVAEKILTYFSHMLARGLTPTDMTFRYLGGAIKNMKSKDKFEVIHFILEKEENFQFSRDFLDVAVNILLQNGDEDVRCDFLFRDSFWKEKQR